MTTAAGAGDLVALPRAGWAPARERLEALAPWLAAALVLLVGALLVDPMPVGVVHDDGMYVILAKSLATGQGYRWLHLPGAPQATHFPPGYPAFLALLWLVGPAFPANLVLFKLANACFGAVSAAALAHLAHTRLGFSRAGAAVLAAAALLGIPTLTLGVLVMSEPLFLALLLAALILAERAVAALPRKRDLLALGLLAGVATLVRTHGIALVAAVPLVLATRRRFAAAGLCLVGALAVVLPWQLWVAAHDTAFIPALRGNYGSYGAWLATGLHAGGVGLFARTAGRTTIELAAMFATLMAPTLGAAPRITALVVLGALSAVGAPVLWRRAPVAAVFLVLYTAIVVFWPFTPARFVWGIWPLVMIVPVLGARAAIAWRPAGPLGIGVRIAAVAAAACLMVGYGAYTARGYRGRWWGSIPRARSANLGPLVQWAALRTAPGDILAVEAEGAVYLYAGRATVPVNTFTVQQYFQPRTPHEDADVLRAIFARYPVRAAAITSTAMRAAAAELTAHTPPQLVVTDSFPGGIVYSPAGPLTLAPPSR